MWLTLFIHSIADGPLYPGAQISCRESWTSIYKYSVSNRLTDRATQQLLDLIASHCPTPNSCPMTVHKLGPTGCIHSQFCSLCMSPVPLDKKDCANCNSRASQMCYYSLLPFEEHLQEIVCGTYDLLWLCTAFTLSLTI